MILTLTGLTLLSMPGLTIQTYGHTNQLQVKPLAAYHGKILVPQHNEPHYKVTTDSRGALYLTQTKGN